MCHQSMQATIEQSKHGTDVQNRGEEKSMELIYKDALLKELGITNEDCEKCAWGDGYGYCTRGSEFTDACDAICTAPTIEERKMGKWMEKHHAYSDEESVIEEWQSCRCSECGRYDTRPYMYYFSEPNYCSYCGADMREQP